MIKQRLRLLDTAALANHYHVAPGTIRRWACEDHWASYGTRRTRQWNMIEVQASYDRRHATESETCAVTSTERILCSTG